MAKKVSHFTKLYHISEVSGIALGLYHGLVFPMLNVMCNKVKYALHD